METEAKRAVTYGPGYEKLQILAREYILQLIDKNCRDAIDSLTGSDDIERSPTVPFPLEQNQPRAEKTAVDAFLAMPKFRGAMVAILREELEHISLAVRAVSEDELPVTKETPIDFQLIHIIPMTGNLTQHFLRNANIQSYEQLCALTGDELLHLSKNIKYVRFGRVALRNLRMFLASKNMCLADGLAEGSP